MLTRLEMQTQQVERQFAFNVCSLMGPQTKSQTHFMVRHQLDEEIDEEIWAIIGEEVWWRLKSELDKGKSGGRNAN